MIAIPGNVRQAVEQGFEERRRCRVGVERPCSGIAQHIIDRLNAMLNNKFATPILKAEENERTEEALMLQHLLVRIQEGD